MDEESGDRMEVEYELTVDDIVAFQEYHIRKSPTVRRQYLLAWIIPPAISAVVGVSIVAGADVLTGPFWSPWLLVFLGFFSAFYAIGFPRRYSKRIDKLVRRMLSEGENKGILGKHRLSVRPGALKETSELTDGTIKWPAVEKIAVADHHAFIYIGAMNAFIVPKRAFPDESKFQSFVETSRRYHQGDS